MAAHPFFDDYDREFLGFIENKELRIALDTQTGAALGLHARSWRRDPHTKVQWKPAQGAGKLVSYVVFHRQYAKDFPVPYCVGLVELTEGPRLLARLVLTDKKEPAVGMPLRAHFDAGGLFFQEPQK